MAHEAEFKTCLKGIATGGIGLEVGAHLGDATRVLVDVLKPASITLIDPWVHDEEYRHRPFACNTRDNKLKKAQGRLRDEFADNAAVSFVADRSERILPTLTNDSLDWIYLDGCKFYREYLTELETALAKVKPEGVIVGAGVTWAPQLGYPVKAALGALMLRLGDDAKLELNGDYYQLRLPKEKTVAPRPELTSYLVVSTMKNEAPFILEWVAYYRSLGFTDFLIYTNDCDDTTVPMLDRLTERGIVHHEPNLVLRRGPHKSALKYAQDHVLAAQAKWVLICDVDEFLNLKVGDGTIQGFLKSLPDNTDVVPFPWLVFGSGGTIEYKDDPITEQFSACEAPPRNGGRKWRDVKTMFRTPEKIDRFGLHRPRFKDNRVTDLKWYAPSGKNISELMNTTVKATMPWKQAFDYAFMNHYPLRSIEAYMIKKNRGRANHHKEVLGLEYFDKWNLNSHSDKSIQSNLEGMREELAGLIADDETGRLHAQGVKMMKQRLVKLLTDLSYKELFDDLSSRAN